jgi:hypothetical protein
VPLNVYAFSHYPEQIITTYQPDGTIVGTPQHYLNLTSEAAASEFPFVDRDNKIGNFAPYAVAWNLEAEHRFSEHLTMRAKYLESHGSGLITISPQMVQGQNAFVLAGDGISKYRQFELTAQLSLQPNNRIYASYVRSLSQGTLNESDTYLGDFSSPFIRGNLYTNRPGDIPNRFLIWGSVALPWKVKVYPKIEVAERFSLSIGRCLPELHSKHESRQRSLSHVLLCGRAGREGCQTELQIHLETFDISYQYYEPFQRA